jgi:hypothetical protein
MLCVNRPLLAGFPERGRFKSILGSKKNAIAHVRRVRLSRHRFFVKLAAVNAIMLRISVPVPLQIDPTRTTQVKF